jgi:hypothetical protein
MKPFQYPSGTDTLAPVSGKCMRAMFTQHQEVKYRSNFSESSDSHHDKGEQEQVAV